MKTAEKIYYLVLYRKSLPTAVLAGDWWLLLMKERGGELQIGGECW